MSTDENFEVWISLDYSLQEETVIWRKNKARGGNLALNGL